MTLGLAEIHNLAYRFVPAVAATNKLRDCGERSWWPAHEIGHFLVATPAECRQVLFGIDSDDDGYILPESPKFHYVVAKEVAATSISQRLLRRSGHTTLADEEIQYTDEATLDCSFERWCRRAVRTLLCTNKVMRLPATFLGLEALLTRKAHESGTTFYPSRRAAEGVQQ